MTLPTPPALPPVALPPLDPDAARVLEGIHAPGVRGFEAMEVAEARAVYAATRAASLAPPLAVAEVADITLPLPRRAVPARLYRPAGASGAGLVYLHGGGWVLGDLDSHDNLCRRLALASGAALLSVEYALAPEAPFPAGLEEARAALSHVLSDPARYGMEAGRIAVGGDSAGGNLASAACLCLRDAGQPLPAFQLLIYPALDLSMSCPSQTDFAEGHLLTRRFQRWCHRLYLAETGADTDWRVSPLFAPQLQGLPPAFVLTASHDPLRDEGEVFAMRLAQAGVPTGLWRVPGQIHAFLPMDGAIGAVAGICDRLGRILAAALSPVPR